MKLDTTVAFAADMTSTFSPRTAAYSRVPQWRTSGSPGLFDTTNGAFSPATGIFTVNVPARLLSDVFESQ
jgi:hypothetical protein